MKFKTLIMSAMAVLAVAVGCKPQELDGTNLSLAVEGAEEGVLSVAKERSEVAIEVKADCNWAVSTDVEWITFSKTEGSGNGTVLMYVEANEKAAREALVHFQKADTRKVSADFTVKQAAGYEVVEGDGTLERPYLASQASAVCAELENGATTTDKVYVKGYVKKFASKHSDGIASFGNALFYITDDPDGQVTPDFYCYQVYYLKGQRFTSEDQIKLGDEVVVYGQLTNYNGTYETVGKGAAYCYSINGKTEAGDTPGPVDAVDVTVAQFNEAEVSTTQLYRLKGKVGGSINLQYGNFDLTDATGTVYVYGLSNISDVKDKLLNNAEITVVGYRGDYNGKVEVLNGTCESISGGDEPTPGPATGTYDSEFAWTLGSNAYDQDAVINGETVAHVLKLGTAKATGSATITIPAGVSAVEFYAYAWKGKTATLKVNMGTASQSLELKANDGLTGNPTYTITASASDKYVIDLGTTLTSDVTVTVEHETERVVIFGLKKSDGSGVDPDPTEVLDVTVAQFNAAAVSDTQLYRLKGKVGGSINLQYGNFDLTDATGTVYVYGLSNIASVKDKLLNNAEITVVGKRGDYNGKIEVVDGECESIEGGDVPEPVGGVFYTLDTSLSSAAGQQNGYATEEDTPIVVDGIGWNACGNLTMSPWRIGGKSLSNAERVAYTTTGMTKAASKVVFTCGSNNGVTINSAKLLYGPNADFSGAKEVAFTVTANASVEIPVSAASGSYFKFVFNVTVSGSSNKYFQFSKVEFAE